jgi:DNA 3'-phosphatase
MTNLIKEYSSNWKLLNSSLIFQSNDFQFSNVVLITELDGCLINNLSSGKLYHKLDPQTVSIKNDEFIKIIKKNSKDLSIVIISNQITGNKLVIDMIKRKLEDFIELTKIPILAFFALTNNKLSKPHTGLWTLLKLYYKTKGNANILKAFIVSEFGGNIIDKKKKITYSKSVIDRAFAHNINIPFYTVEEYVNNLPQQKFIWNNVTISPELRKLYIEKLSTYKNENIFKLLINKGPADVYAIYIFGAPCSGKTTLSNELISKWNESQYGKNHAIKRLDLTQYTKKSRINAVKKFIIDKISVIIDGGCHSIALREPYEEIFKKYKVPTVYVEVNPSIGFACIFNHVAVENSNDESKTLYDVKEYHIYKSILNKPKDTIQYCPVIKQTKQVMLYRY